MTYRFKDMRDWSVLNRGVFNKVRESFNLQQKLDEVKALVIEMAKNKAITIHFNTYFEKNDWRRDKLFENCLDLE